MNNAPMRWHSQLRLQRADGVQLGSVHFQLLGAIAHCGSLTKAAKQVGISYKTAWDYLQQLQLLTDLPLLTRISGGRGGGGSSLTPHGQQLFAEFMLLSHAQQRFVELWQQQGFRPSPGLNQWRATLRQRWQTPEASSQTLLLDVGLPQPVLVQQPIGMTFEIGQAVQIYCPANAVMLVLGDQHRLPTSARNCWQGQICGLTSHGGRATVQVQITPNHGLQVAMTDDSIQQLGLQLGQAVTLFAKASALSVLA